MNAVPRVMLAQMQMLLSMQCRKGYPAKRETFMTHGVVIGTIQTAEKYKERVLRGENLREPHGCTQCNVLYWLLPVHVDDSREPWGDNWPTNPAQYNDQCCMKQCRPEMKLKGVSLAHHHTRFATEATGQIRIEMATPTITYWRHAV